MKKIGFVLFTVIAALSAINCGNAACDDYAAKAQKCCDKITDATAKASCESQIKAVTDVGNADACTAGSTVLGTTCD